MPLTQVAVVQAGSIAFDTERSLEKAASLTAEAARQGAKLVVFPEAFIGGYPKGADFGTRVGFRSAEGRRWFRRYFDAAIDIPGPHADSLCEIAGKHRTLMPTAMERIIWGFGDGSTLPVVDTPIGKTAR